MSEIEVYDILTLEDNEEYSVLKKIKENNKTYLLLAPVDKEEVPNFDELKIVEEVIENQEVIVEDVTDDELLKSLSTKFLASINKDTN